MDIIPYSERQFEGRHRAGQLQKHLFVIQMMIVICDSKDHSDSRNHKKKPDQSVGQWIVTVDELKNNQQHEWRNKRNRQIFNF